MFSGFYTAASGMLMNRRALDVTANNMANQQTPGYRAKRVVGTTFNQQLVRAQSGKKTVIGESSPTALVSEVMTQFDGTNLMSTGRAMDLAIDGEGFFTIQGEEQTLLTRNGCFNVDNEGYLVLEGVGRVLGDNGAIRVNGSGFTVGKTGTVYDLSGTAIDRLRIVQPEDTGALVPSGNGVYNPGEAALNRVNPSVEQFMLEGSNVDLTGEMSRVMEVQRAFQTCSRALTIIDQMNQKTASEIGKL